MDNALLLESVAQFGTPQYLYDLDAVVKRIENIKNELPSRVELYYAVKANPNLSLLKKIRPLIRGLDISSAGEMLQALSAGYDPIPMNLAGPGKSTEELTACIKKNIGSISIESEDDLARIIQVVEHVDPARPQPVLLRINPEKLIPQFAVKMGGKATQFGVDEEDIDTLIPDILACKKIQLRGIHVYSGTQCLNSSALGENFRATLALARRIEKSHKTTVSVINLGGGFGVPYFTGDQPLDISHTLTELSCAIAEHEAQVAVPPVYIIELGRYLVAEAGYYLTRVVNRKRSRGVSYCMLDGGMHQHLSASGNLGQVIKKNYPVRNISRNAPAEAITLAGPLCTPLDVLGQNVMLPKPEQDDVVVFNNSGAYGYSASPLLFLGHTTPVEVVYDEKLMLSRPAFEVTQFNA